MSGVFVPLTWGFAVANGVWTIGENGRTGRHLRPSVGASQSHTITQVGWSLFVIYLYLPQLPAEPILGGLLPPG